MAQEFLSSKFREKVNGVVHSLSNPVDNLINERTGLVSWDDLNGLPETLNLLYLCTQISHCHLLNTIRIDRDSLASLLIVIDSVDLNLILSVFESDNHYNDANSLVLRIGIFNLLTSLIENLLYDIADVSLNLNNLKTQNKQGKKDKMKNSGHPMLSSLIANTENAQLSIILPVSLLRILRLLMFPEHLNLRNISWHGFLSPTDLPIQYISLCIIILVNLNHFRNKLVHPTNLSNEIFPPLVHDCHVEKLGSAVWLEDWWQRRPPNLSFCTKTSILDSLTGYEDYIATSFQILDSSSISSPTSSLSSSSSSVPSSSPLSILSTSETSALKWFQILLLPVFEHSIRCLFVDIHIDAYDVTHHSNFSKFMSEEDHMSKGECFGVSKKACEGHYYATLDGFGQRHLHQVLLDPDVHAVVKQSNKEDTKIAHDDTDDDVVLHRANQLYRHLPLGLISCLLDLIVYTDGPRIRANLSHSSTLSFRSCDDVHHTLLLAAAWIAFAYHFKQNKSNCQGQTNINAQKNLEKDEARVASQQEEAAAEEEAEEWWFEGYQFITKYTPVYHPLSLYVDLIRKTLISLRWFCEFISHRSITLRKADQEISYNFIEKEASGAIDDKKTEINIIVEVVISSRIEDNVTTKAHNSGEHCLHVIEKQSKLMMMHEDEESSNQQAAVKNKKNKPKSSTLPIDLSNQLSTTLLSLIGSLPGSGEKPVAVAAVAKEDNSYEKVNINENLEGPWTTLQSQHLFLKIQEWGDLIGGCNLNAEKRLIAQLSVMIDPYHMSSSSSSSSSSSNSLSSNWDLISKELSTNGLNASVEILKLIYRMNSAIIHNMKNYEDQILKGIARERIRKQYLTSMIILSTIMSALHFISHITVALTSNHSHRNKEEDKSADNSTNKPLHFRGKLMGKMLNVVIILSTCVLAPPTTATPTKTFAQCLPLLIEFLQSRHFHDIMESL